MHLIVFFSDALWLGLEITTSPGITEQVEKYQHKNYQCIALESLHDPEISKNMPQMNGVHDFNDIIIVRPFPWPAKADFPRLLID